MSKRSENALIALRQIQRRTEQASKKLAAVAGLTPSQLLVMQILLERGGEVTAGKIAQLTQLKHATITSLADKLESRDMISRRRSSEDRRKVWIKLLPPGARAITSSPDLLQDTFETGFEELEDWQQSMLVSALKLIAKLIDAEELEAAPILDVGALDEGPK